MARRVAAHGIIGGVSSECWAASSARASLASPYLRNIPTAEARVIASAVIGGTASEIAGGKFANGAASAAFGCLYNELSLSEVERRISFTSSVEGGEHFYKHRVWICKVGPICGMELGEEVYAYINQRNVPFSSNDLGAGEKYPLGQPIYHMEILTL